MSKCYLCLLFNCLTKLCEIMLRNYELKMYLGNVRICMDLELRCNLTNAWIILRAWMLAEALENKEKKLTV